MYPPEYIEFLYHFHCDRDYFECHEILEELWKKILKKRENKSGSGSYKLPLAFIITGEKISMVLSG